MIFTAKAQRVAVSPYKLRPVADVIRGKNVQYAINWLTTYSVRKAVPLQKMLESAAANAKYLNNVEPVALVIKEIRIDQGPIFRYFKPGAQGRSNIYRKRSSHMSIILESIESTKD
jgi:large subunit ribosomal protein L22